MKKSNTKNNKVSLGNEYYHPFSTTPLFIDIFSSLQVNCSKHTSIISESRLQKIDENNKITDEYRYIGYMSEQLFPRRGVRFTGLSIPLVFFLAHPSRRLKSELIG